MIDFSKITSEVRKAILGTDKMPAAKLLQVYTIDDKASNGKLVILKSDKGHVVGTSFNGLAAMRITDNADAVKDLLTTREARGHASVTNFQTAIERENAPLIVDGNLKLKCVKKVTVWDSVNNRPVYRNDAYEGYKAYRTTCDEINVANPATEDDALQAIRNAKFTAAATELRNTAVKHTGDDYLQQMPIFVAGV
jgi:hypothetical protein